MKQYEYKPVTRLWSAIEELVLLYEHGKEGWRLVTVVIDGNWRTYYFEREVKDGQ